MWRSKTTPPRSEIATRVDVRPPDSQHKTCEVAPPSKRRSASIKKMPIPIRYSIVNTYWVRNRTFGRGFSTCSQPPKVTSHPQGYIPKSALDIGDAAILLYRSGRSRVQTEKRGPRPSRQRGRLGRSHGGLRGVASKSQRTPETRRPLEHAG